MGSKKSETPQRQYEGHNTLLGHHTAYSPVGLGQYNSLGEYCDPYTASSVFLILIYPRRSTHMTIKPATFIWTMGSSDESAVLILNTWWISVVSASQHDKLGQVNDNTLKGFHEVLVFVGMVLFFWGI